MFLVLAHPGCPG